MVDPKKESETCDRTANTQAFLRICMDPALLIGTHAAVTAALKAGLFRVLYSGPQSAAECAEKLGLNRRATECVLDVLVSSGFASQKGSLYQLTGPLRDLGLPAVEGSLQVFAQHFDHTMNLLKTGAPLAFMDDSREQREASYSGIVGGMGKEFRSAAHTLATKLSFQPSRIIDVGCGSGVWSLAVASLYPDAQVIGLDFPKVLEVFEGRAQASGLEKQIKKLPGDMYTVELPAEPIDLVIIANVLRLEAPEKARALVARFAAALRPGGRLLIVDAFAGGTLEKELQRTVYALYLALRTSVGRVYAPAEVKEWMRAAGVSEPVEIDLGSHLGAIGALLSERPG